MTLRLTGVRVLVPDGPGAAVAAELMREAGAEPVVVGFDAVPRPGTPDRPRGRTSPWASCTCRPGPRTGRRRRRARGPRRAAARWTTAGAGRGRTVVMAGAGSAA
ncbi:hypothetical protein I6I09_01325 [Corynebacterium bovis]|uniref:hypothetical protein n=1 Tax=Corynebacterium bovis TaxID=36808 RepID=UPI0018E11DD8|nr:hypothetical protein [Corynebacterium bovis]QQC47652.1 hypothetical protein I6I09_01325 [Corynebacterium bovis]